MILLGDKNIEHERLFYVQSIQMIQETPPNSTLLFSYDISMMQFCMKNNLNYALKIQNITHAIYANALNARYVIVSMKEAKNIQRVAENYMFDTKVLSIVQNSSQIEAVANDGIDGIVYEDIL